MFNKILYLIRKIVEIIMNLNIFLTGKSGCGKSTMINKILDSLSIEYSGYRTLSYYINGQDKGFYIIGYEDVEGNYSPISIKIGEKKCCGIKETFEIVGSEILRKSRENSNIKLILMDEIGVLESDALKFKEEIIKCLNSDHLVIGVIKKKDSEFLNYIKFNKGNIIIDIEDKSNGERELIINKIITMIKNNI